MNALTIKSEDGRTHLILNGEDISRNIGWFELRQSAGDLPVLRYEVEVPIDYLEAEIDGIKVVQC